MVRGRRRGGGGRRRSMCMLCVGGRGCGVERRRRRGIGRGLKRLWRGSGGGGEGGSAM